MFSTNTSLDRINALFSTFPETRTEWNTASYDEKLQFWSTTLKEFVREQKCSPQRLAFPSRQLQHKFVHNDSFPLCIDKVLEILLERKVLVLASELSKSTLGQVAGLFLKPIWWSLGYHNNSLTNTDTQVIHLELLTEYSNEVASKAATMEDRTMDHIDFVDLLQICGLNNEADYTLVRQYLEHSNVLETRKLENMIVYKFKDEPKDAINDTDIGRVHLRQSIRSLQSQVTELERKISACQENTKKCLVEKKKQMAMYHLKQKKALEAVVQKRLSSLETLELMLHKIQASKTDIEILEAYKVGSKTLSDILGQKELQIDNVEATMDQLQEVLQDQQDIENAMHTNVVDADMEELEKELDMLVEEEKVDSIADQLEKLTLPSNPLPTVELNHPESKEIKPEVATPLLA
jgi:charged multivesicular body protein 7